MTEKSGKNSTKTSVWAVLLVVLMIAGSFGVLFTPANAAPLGGEYGGEVNVAILSSSALDLTPTTTDVEGQKIVDLVYDSLARVMPDTLNVEPWMADSWVVNNTASTITVTLKNGIMWHDGTALVAGDIVDVYSGAAGVTSVTASDDHTLVFHLSALDASFFSHVLTLPVYKVAGSDYVGSGPYTIVSSNDTVVKLAAFDDYFNGRVYLDGISVYIYGTLDTAADAYINGTADGATLEYIWTSLEPYQARQVIPLNDTTETTLTDQGKQVITNELEYYYLAFNMNKAPFNNTAFRQAVAHCIDKDLIVNNVLNTYGLQGDSVIHPSMTFWYNSSVERYDYDTTLASQILSQAGFNDPDGDGWLNMPDGSPIDITIYAPPGTGVGAEPERDQIGAQIHSNLLSIGINITQESLSTSDIQSHVDDNNFSLALLPQEISLDPAYISEIYNALNNNGYTNATVAALLNDANSEMDGTARQTLVRHIQGLITEEVPLDVIYYLKKVQVYKDDTFKGWNAMLGGVGNFWTFTSLKADVLGDLSISITPSTVSLDAGDSTTLNIMVSNADGAFDGATVVLSTSAGTLSETEVVTGSDGTATVTITAPTSVSGAMDINIHGKAVAFRYNPVEADAAITVHEMTPSLAVTMTTSSALLNSGDSTDVVVTVTSAGTAVFGATVSFTVTPSAGGMMANATGITDATGKVTTTFSADVTVDTTYTITASASMDGYSPASYSRQVIVQPQQLSVTVSAASPVLNVGDSTELTISVTAADGTGLPGATVVIYYKDASGTLKTVNLTTGADGSATTTFEPTVSTGEDVTYTIVAEASMPGYVGDSDMTSVTVRTPVSPGVGFIGIISVLGVAMLLAGYRRIH